MFSRRLFVFLALLVPCSLAQFQHVQKNGSVRVQVLFSDGHPCDLHVRVTLWAKSSPIPISQTSTVDACRADFSSLAAGDYYVEVAGNGIEATESPIFEVGATTQSVEVAVRRSQQSSVPTSSTISAASLNIPDKARKEFEKANSLINKQDWTRALEHLSRAVALYPQFIPAYNNLAVVYARLGDRNHEREALQKALSLDNHFAPALTNLAEMDITDHDFPEAESLLGRVAAINPENLRNLVLLAKLQLLNQHYDDAVATCRKVHLMQHSSWPLVHYIAARALEAGHRLAEAVNELRTFLQEQPSGPNTDAARKEMALLENREH